MNANEKLFLKNAMRRILLHEEFASRNWESTYIRCHHCRETKDDKPDTVDHTAWCPLGCIMTICVPHIEEEAPNPNPLLDVPAVRHSVVGILEKIRTDPSNRVVIEGKDICLYCAAPSGHAPNCPIEMVSGWVNEAVIEVDAQGQSTPTSQEQNDMQDILTYLADKTKRSLTEIATAMNFDEAYTAILMGYLIYEGNVSVELHKQKGKRYRSKV